MKKNKIIGISLQLLLLLALYLYFEYDAKRKNAYASACPSGRMRERFPLRYEGIIIKKYIDRSDHGAKMISVAQFSDTMHILCAHNKERNTPFDIRLWEYALVGDSLIKRENSTQVEIRRGNTSTMFDIDCQPDPPYDNQSQTIR